MSVSLSTVLNDVAEKFMKNNKKIEESNVQKNVKKEIWQIMLLRKGTRNLKRANRTDRRTDTKTTTTKSNGSSDAYDDSPTYDDGATYDDAPTTYDYASTTTNRDN